MQNIAAEFTIEKKQAIDTIFTINANPTKVSQLENDLNFQTGDQVETSINEASAIINERIDGVVEAFDNEIEASVLNVYGEGNIEVTREGRNITVKTVNFVFEQSIASDRWVIVHNLNKKPGVILTDSAGTEFKASIEYDSLDQCTVYINGATTGKAYLN